MKYKHGIAFPDADDYLYDRLPESGIWQQDALEAGLMYVQQWRTAIDGGAHVGTWSRQLAPRFSRVIAFEPAADTFQCLIENTLPLGVECHQQALGAAPGIVTIQRDLRDMQRRHTGARYCVDSDTKDPDAVRRVTIDSLGLADLDFLKLDLEGGEPDALKGAIETLQRCKPVVVFERGKFCCRYCYERNASEKILERIGAKPLADLGLNLVWGWDG